MPAFIVLIVSGFDLFVNPLIIVDFTRICTAERPLSEENKGESILHTPLIIQLLVVIYLTPLLLVPH